MSGGGGGVPAHTTSETTVNQSPWQNKTYQALMLGTKNNPGPITSMLRNASNLTAQYNAINKAGITRNQMARMSTYNPQKAAEGGLMAIKGYAKGGKPAPSPTKAAAQEAKQQRQEARQEAKQQRQEARQEAAQARKEAQAAKPKPLNDKEKAAVAQYNKAIIKGKEPPPKVVTAMNKAETRTHRNASPLIDTGTKPVGDPRLQGLMSRAATSPSYPKDIVGTPPMDTIKTAFPNSPAVKTYDAGIAAIQKTAATEASIEGAASGEGGQDITLMDTMRKIAYFDPETGKSTLPDFLSLQEKVRNLKTPAEFDKAAQDYGVAANALKELTKYKPEEIKVAQAKAQEYTASEMQAPERFGVTTYNAKKMAAARDAAATRADVTGYDAATIGKGTSYTASEMKAPERFGVTDYEAAKQEASKFGDVSKVEGQKYDASDIAKTKREEAKEIGDISKVSGQKYDASKMAKTARETVSDIGDVGTVSGQAYDASKMAKTAREEAATAAGPKSWTDAGVAQQYMSPYMQNVVDIEKREAARDYAQELQKLKASASGVGAFGGSRQAIMEAEAQRNYAQRLADIQAKGQQEAYQSGMGQFTAEQGLTTDVAKANAQMVNQLKDKYMSMGLTEAEADQRAQNEAKQYQATSKQQAETTNQATELARQKANQDTQAALKAKYMDMGMTEAAADQKAENDAKTFAATSAQEAEKANQATELAKETTNAQMVNQLKDKYMSMGLTEAEADQRAQNEAKQFQATSAQEAEKANQQAELTKGSAQLQADMEKAKADQDALNQQRQLKVQQDLEAAKTFYGGELTAEQVNQTAKDSEARFNAENQQAINLADQAVKNTEAAFRATASNEASRQFASESLTASAANQQADLTKAKADQDAINQQRQLKVQQELEAAKTFYGGELTAEQANQIAKNTEAQFNAENRQQIEIANQQTSLAEQQANQSAGISGAQIAAGAAQGMAGVAQGEAGLGTERNRVELANIGALGQTAEAEQNLGQSYADTNATNVANWYNMPNTINQPVVNAINAQPVSGGTTATAQTSTPASPFGGKQGGLMTRTRAHEAWLAARGKQMDRRGIASRG